MYRQRSFAHAAIDKIKFKHPPVRVVLPENLEARSVKVKLS